MKFARELESSIGNLPGDDKIDILTVLSEITVMFENGSDYAPVHKIIDERLLLKYKGKLKTFYNKGITDYLLQRSFKLLELQDELGKDDPEQFLSDDEYKTYLEMLHRLLRMRRELAIVGTEIVAEEEENAAEDNSTTNPEHTARRQTLAIYYLNMNFAINKSSEKALAHFIHFLTGKNEDNIYKVLRNPLKISDIKKKRADDELVKDLEFIKTYFDNLGSTAIIKAIERDIQEVKSTP